MKKLICINSAILIAVSFIMLSGCTTATSTQSSSTVSGGQEITTGYEPIQSELIYSINYDKAAKTLTVVLYDEGVYDFADVPDTVYDALLKADDHDTYYKEHIAKKYKGKKFIME